MEDVDSRGLTVFAASRRTVWRAKRLGRIEMNGGKRSFHMGLW